MPEIIPKEKEKKSSQNILPYIALTLLVLCIVSYFVFLILINQSQNRLISLKEELAKQKTPEMVSLENSIFATKERIDDFAILLENHTSTSKFFNFIENNTHPDIYFSNLTLDLSQLKATLSGTAKSFTALDQQVQIFKKEKLLENVNVSDIKITEEGKIEFTLDLIFNPTFFKF